MKPETTPTLEPSFIELTVLDSGRSGPVRNSSRKCELRKDMPNATVTSKGQITVPKEIRDHLGVEPGDRISFQIGRGGEVIVQSETVDVRSLRGVLKRRGRPVSLRAMELAIRRGAAGR
ncbi:MAG TPA: type II toxin-antitoxin system PrlF family antitoxin [Thermoanaerobaculia bacterium]|nr:type II toxin-antitoxin system PrlF family antitoxin [Thermoanaerobaculia bacterium]